ncbi:MAG: cupin domain-containing protein [Thermoplasmatales archaeon]|nr:MAG: cupin domain-containing protein [Thermoplasmatales archaeon]
MLSFFPEPISLLPEADIPIDGVKGYLLQGENNQVIFMEFSKDIDIPKHSHESQWEVVVKGKVDLNVAGDIKTYRRGDTFFIPKDVKHSARVYAGYASIAYFNEKQRYKKK